MKRVMHKTILGLTVGAILLSPLASPFAWAASSPETMRTTSPDHEDVEMRSPELRRYIIEHLMNFFTKPSPGWTKLSGEDRLTRGDAKEVRSLHLHVFWKDGSTREDWENALLDLSDEGKFPNLKELELTGEQYHIISENHLSLPPQVEIVRVTGNVRKNVNVTLEPLERIRQLKELSLHYVTLDDSRGLEKHTSLESLSLDSIYQDIDDLDKMPYDTYIAVLKKRLPTMDLSFLNRLSHLKFLRICGYVAGDLTPLHDTPSFANLHASQGKFPPMQIGLFHFAKFRHHPGGDVKKEAYFQLFDLENLTMPKGEKISSKFCWGKASDTFIDGNPGRLAFKHEPYKKPLYVGYLDGLRENPVAYGRDLLNDSLAFHLLPDDREGYPLIGLYLVPDFTEFFWESEIYGKSVNVLNHQKGTPYHFTEEDLHHAIPGLPENARVKVLKLGDLDERERQKYLTEEELQKIEGMTVGEIRDFLEDLRERPALLNGKLLVHVTFYDGSIKEIPVPVQEQSEPTSPSKPEKPVEDKTPEGSTPSMQIAIGDFGPNVSEAKPSHPVELLLTHEPYMQGYPDGSFRTDNGLTRAEAGAILARLKGLDTDDRTIPPFKDMTDPKAWYNGVIHAVVKDGCMQGYPDGTFRPDEVMSRAEFARLSEEVMKRTDASLRKESSKEEQAPVSFPDIQGHWAAKTIENVVGRGVLKGYPNGLFEPDRVITRAEAAKVFNELFDRSADRDFLARHRELTRRYKDLTDKHWAYDEIMEASVLHRFIRDGQGKEVWKEIEGPEWTK